MHGSLVTDRTLYIFCVLLFFLQSSLPNEAVYDKEKNGVSVSSCIPGFINIRLDLLCVFVGEV